MPIFRKTLVRDLLDTLRYRPNTEEGLQDFLLDLRHAVCVLPHDLAGPGATSLWMAKLTDYIELLGEGEQGALTVKLLGINAKLTQAIEELEQVIEENSV